MYRAFGGTFTWLIVIVTAIASLNGMLHGSGMSDISMNLIIISTSISSLHKYSVFIHQEQGLGRLGRWMKRANEQNKISKNPDTTTDRILKKSLVSFYYSGIVAASLLLVKIVVTGYTYNALIPGLDQRYQPLILIFMEAFSFSSLSLEVIMDALILMNSLFVFRRELMKNVDEWRKMNYKSDNPQQFRQQLKTNVQNHVELLTIFQDVKNYCNSMFGYQVFAIVFTTCALLYGMAKDSGFDQAVLVQVMPTSLASFLEFFILCWCGEEIQHGFQQVHTSIYDTNWYEAPLREKKSMTIVLEFSKNTIQLTGFTVFKADLKTFVESMRQSFSLYTLLQKLV
ncbi:hypothetical protein GE061_017922 [Apolygus lucorum]|uniref:Odorant receptor n=2 Tax=Apolygus lucorum TaxID=248454 RepID=A0A8S9XF27_APOLU|nr:hypothetical protein GE061_017922 [Apolygus lucorum]